MAHHFDFEEAIIEDMQIEAERDQRFQQQQQMDPWDAAILQQAHRDAAEYRIIPWGREFPISKYHQRKNIHWDPLTRWLVHRPWPNHPQNFYVHPAYQIILDEVKARAKRGVNRYKKFKKQRNQWAKKNNQPKEVYADFKIAKWNKANMTPEKYEEWVQWCKNRPEWAY